MDSNAELLLGEQHDTEAGSKWAKVQRKINTVKLKLVTSLDLVCYFQLMYLFSAVYICCRDRATVWLHQTYHHQIISLHTLSSAALKKSQFGFVLCWIHPAQFA